MSNARNNGISCSTGRYILPLDADDMIARTMVERTVDVLELDSSVAVVYTDLQQFGEGHDLIRAAEFDPAMLPEANQLSYCSLYRRHLWEAVGGYNPNMVWGYEDWDFWVGAVQCGYVARRIPEPLFLYRIRTDTMYSTAVAHDRELRRQVRTNHPALYTWQHRFGRQLRKAGHSVARRARRAQRAIRD